MGIRPADHRAPPDIGTVTSLVDERIHTALAIRVDDRWYCDIGPTGRVQTAWSLAGAALIIPSKFGIEEAERIAAAIKAKRPRAVVEIKRLAAT